MEPIKRAFLCGMILGGHLAYAGLYLVTGQPVAGFAIAWAGLFIVAIFTRVTRPPPA
jgi:hypothetical protein